MLKAAIRAKPVRRRSGRFRVQHYCIACRAPYPEGFHPFCDICGSLVEVEYQLDKVELLASPNPYVRFASLLPIERMHHRLPDSTYTPLIHAQRLGRELGLDCLFLKNETTLPTKTTKDRMAAVSLAYLYERGVRELCASSTGNSGTSLAYAMSAYPEMRLYLFTAENFVPRVQHADKDTVVNFGMRDATFVEAANYAAAYARIHGLVSEGGFFSPGRREGLKLAFLEATEQCPAPIDWYVQAASSAMGVYGAYKGAKELLAINSLSKLPRLLCVQQASCAPMARAFLEGSPNIRPEHVVAKPAGIAEAILRGDPTRCYPYVRKIVLESGGSFAIVNEAEIRSARQLVEELEGISPCFSASAAIAGLIQLARRRELAPSAVVLINLTGADRPDKSEPLNVRWIHRVDGGWSAEPPSRIRDQRR